MSLEWTPECCRECVIEFRPSPNELVYTVYHNGVKLRDISEGYARWKQSKITDMLPELHGET